MLRLLTIAAVLGVVAGVVLSKSRHTEVEIMSQLDTRVVDEALPVFRTGPPRLTPDMMAPDPLSLRGIPPYPGAGPRKIVGSRPGVAINAVSWFATGDSVEKVLSFYEQAYTAHNIIYASHRWAQKSGYVSWFEHYRPEDGGLPEFGQGVLHMISAFRDGQTTTVLVSATDPLAMLNQIAALPGGISLPPGAKPQVLNLGEAGQQRYSIFASYQTMSREELADELARRMAAEGWKITERVVAPDGQVTLVGKLNSQVQVAVVNGTADRGQVLINLEER